MRATIQGSCQWKGSESIVAVSMNIIATILARCEQPNPVWTAQWIFTFVITWPTRTLIFVGLVPLVSAPCLCPLSLPHASAPCLSIRSLFWNWVGPGLFMSIYYFYLNIALEMWWICQKNRLRYYILPLIYKAIRTINFISLLNSLSGYLLTICRLSAFIRFLLPLYFIVPATYIID
jgi:hypothetical protein